MAVIAEASRRRRLSPEQEAAIRSLAATKSRGAEAANFGVSHETVRAELHGREAPLPVPGEAATPPAHAPAET